MVKYLVDTCVWRDFYEDRLGITGRTLGKYAAKFFSKVIKNKDEIIFSESLFIELKNYYPEEEIDNLLGIFIMTGVLKKISTTKEESAEARKLSIDRNLPFVDCLNAVHARDHCAILISQDKHFLKLSDIANTKAP